MSANTSSAAAALLARQEVGGMLKDAREGMKLEYAPISDALHIPVSYLQALEKGDWAIIPAEVYGRGYIKKYAGYLGFDPQKMLELLHPVVLSKEPIRTPLLRSHKPPISLKPILLISALLFVIVSLMALLSAPSDNTVNIQIKPIPASLLTYLDEKDVTPFYHYSCLEEATEESLWGCYVQLRFTLNDTSALLLPVGSE